MNKKTIIAIVAVIALVAILGTVLVACNKDDYTKRLKNKDYEVASLSDLSEEAFGVQSTKVEWSLEAAKDNEYVVVTKYRNTDDAKKAYEDAKKKIEDAGDKGKDYAVRRHGKVVVFGTKQGVKDAD